MNRVTCFLTSDNGYINCVCSYSKSNIIMLCFYRSECAYMCEQFLSSEKVRLEFQGFSSDSDNRSLDATPLLPD